MMERNLKHNWRKMFLSHITKLVMLKNRKKIQWDLRSNSFEFSSVLYLKNKKEIYKYIALLQTEAVRKRFSKSPFSSLLLFCLSACHKKKKIKISFWSLHLFFYFTLTSSYSELIWSLSFNGVICKHQNLSVIVTGCFFNIRTDSSLCTLPWPTRGYSRGQPLAGGIMLSHQPLPGMSVPPLWSTAKQDKSHYLSPPLFLLLPFPLLILQPHSSREYLVWFVCVLLPWLALSSVGLMEL